METIEALWRYPVKSMRGERIAAAPVTAGDRAYALVDKASNRAAVVRTWATPLMSYRATFDTEPTPDRPPPPIRITAPDGASWSSADADSDPRFSAAFNRSLSLMSEAPAGLLLEFTAGAAGGKMEAVTEVAISGAEGSRMKAHGSMDLAAVANDRVEQTGRMASPWLQRCRCEKRQLRLQSLWLLLLGSICCTAVSAAASSVAQAADPITEKIAPELNRYFSQAAQEAFSRLPKIEPTRQSPTVSFTVLKSGAQPVDPACIPRLEKDFHEGVGLLSQRTGLALDVVPSGTKATMVIVMGDIVGRTEAITEPPIDTWVTETLRAAASPPEEVSYDPSPPDIHTHSRWGLYSSVDRSPLYANSVVDWHSWTLGPDCKFDFAREVAWLYAMGLHDLLARTKSYREFVWSLSRRVGIDDPTMRPERRGRLNSDFVDLELSNLFCWELARRRQSTLDVDLCRSRLIDLLSN